MLGAGDGGRGEEAQMEDTHLGGEIGRIQTTHGRILRLSKRHSQGLYSDCQFHTRRLTRVSLSSHGSPERKQNAGSMSSAQFSVPRRLRRWNRFTAYLDNH